MSDPPRKSHILLWSLGIPAALLFYVLSTGPIEYFYRRAGLSGPPPVWLQVIYYPVTWLGDNTPLEQPLNAYWDWWDALARRP